MVEGNVRVYEKPHPVWWLAHLFLGIISGLVVYVLYKDRNPGAARLHLIVSLVLMVVGTVVFLAAAVFLDATLLTGP